MRQPAKENRAEIFFVTASSKVHGLPEQKVPGRKTIQASTHQRMRLRPRRSQTASLLIAACGHCTLASGLFQRGLGAQFVRRLFHRLIRQCHHVMRMQALEAMATPDRDAELAASQRRPARLESLSLLADRVRTDPGSGFGLAKTRTRHEKNARQNQRSADSMMQARCFTQQRPCHKCGVERP